MQDATGENDNVEQAPFSEVEMEILDLYDQVKKLELETALAKARTQLAGKQPDRLGRHLPRLTICRRERKSSRTRRRC